MKRKSEILLEMVEEIFATDEESFKEVMAYESLEELCDACFEKPYEAVAAALRGNLSYGAEYEVYRIDFDNNGNKIIIGSDNFDEDILPIENEIVEKYKTIFKNYKKDEMYQKYLSLENWIF